MPNLVAMTTSSRRPASALPDEHLVGARPVHVGGVEEGDAELEGPVDGGDRLVVVARRRRSRTCPCSRGPGARPFSPGSERDRFHGGLLSSCVCGLRRAAHPGVTADRARPGPERGRSCGPSSGVGPCSTCWPGRPALRGAGVLLGVDVVDPHDEGVLAGHRVVVLAHRHRGEPEAAVERLGRLVVGRHLERDVLDPFGAQRVMLSTIMVVATRGAGSRRLAMVVICASSSTIMKPM